jgi:predicted TIM-barrel fold metal-dependent hydrolase
MTTLPSAICDPHHHLWEHPTDRYMTAQLRADTDTVPGVERTVFVECGSGYREHGPEAFRPVGETEFVVAADPDGFIAGIVGFADLTAPEIDDVLAAHVAAGAGRFRGIRHVSAWDASPDIRASHTKPPPGLLGADGFRSGIGALARVGLSFDAWLYHPQLPELAALARAHEDVVIVLDHLGGPLGIGPYRGRREEVLAVWREAMADVATCQNVVLKLGGIGMAVFGLGFHRQDRGATAEELAGAWRDEIRWCIERFGVERCMFESNFPVDKVSCSYRDLWDAFAIMVDDASAADRAALFHDNAVRTYRL